MVQCLRDLVVQFNWDLWYSYKITLLRFFQFSPNSTTGVISFCTIATLLCWINMGRVGIHVLSLILVVLLQVFFHLTWYWLLVFSKLFLLCLGMGLEFLISPILLTWMYFVFCLMFCLRLSNDHVIFTLILFNIMYYVNRFSYKKPALHSWNEAYLIMVNGGFDLSLVLVCKTFIVYFCIHIHR